MSEIAMEKLEMVLRFTVASFAVWRLSRLLFDQPGSGSGAANVEADEENLTGARMLAGRTLDLLCLFAVWMSSQTAVWVASGFGGVILCWLTVKSLSRLFGQTGEITEQAEELSCTSCASGMQAHHG